MTKRSRPLSHAGRLLWVLGILLVACFPASALALTAPVALDALESDDREALETIATHEEAVRESALQAALHVDVLVEAQRIQEQSSERFRERIEELAPDLQEQVWEVVRTPGLLEELTRGGPKTGAELDAIAARHPASLEAAIHSLGRSHYGLLSEILRIDQVAWDRFEAVLAELPEESQRALRDLIDHPDLLTLLAHRVRLAVYLGDHFREDPEATRQQLAALASEVALREADAEEEWRAAIVDDDEARAELEASAQLYADEHGYDYEDLTGSEVTTTIQTVVHPYPYWLGYPSHYAGHYLYPYGYWYPSPSHLGFYYGGTHRGQVHFGLPSVHFLHWYFGRHHDRHYGHLSHRFSRHHHRHHHARGHRHRFLSHWAKHREHRDRHGHWWRGPRRDGDRRWQSHHPRDREQRIRRDRDARPIITRFGTLHGRPQERGERHHGDTRATGPMPLKPDLGPREGRRSPRAQREERIQRPREIQRRREIRTPDTRRRGEPRLNDRRGRDAPRARSERSRPREARRVRSQAPNTRKLQQTGKRYQKQAQPSRQRAHKSSASKRSSLRKARPAKQVRRQQASRSSSKMRRGSSSKIRRGGGRSRRSR